MGSELLNEDASHAERKSYAETFAELFPYYISIGMPPAEYWDGDASLARYYREAFQRKQEYDDTVAWLHGLYVYDALSVALSNSFSKGGKKLEYSKEPQMLKQRRLQERTKEEVVKQSTDWMSVFVKRHTKSGSEVSDY